MRLFISLIFLILFTEIYAQFTITGEFPYLAGQTVRLAGFEGFGVYTIDSTKVTEKGIFELHYNSKDRGMGFLAAADNKAYFVVLGNEDIKLKGEVLSAPESIAILSGKENQLFVQYAIDHPKREQALSAWVYLRKIYNEDPLFAQQKYPQQAIEKEMLRIKQEDNDFLTNLDPKSYVSWFLPTRKLLSSVSTVAQYRTEEIPATLAAFRKLDYTDERLYKSGFLKDAIESHFWLLENMGQPLDGVYNEMVISIDCLLTNLSENEKKFNEITKYLFNLLERQSLLQASEYLAIKVLTQNSCTVNDDLAKQLESYRAMKKGNTAPDIVFSGDVLKSGSVIKTPNRLSDIEAAYKVVIFGASWCPKCAEELGQLLPLYKKWKSLGVEVVFISLDTEKSVFNSFAGIFPFVSMCDYNKWNTKSVKDYYVFATPTMFLLDKSRTIILRPNSVKQIDAWVDYSIGKVEK
ncbi:MAG TPA: thioredoxin-like domain-containing protein [Bacteroidales bacterium]|nr:thioredoxin-like domain-containing protein [Bacteroidales bacterium]